MMAFQPRASVLCALLLAGGHYGSSAAVDQGTTNTVDVVIVGAGQAGMAAAHRLVGLGYSVHVVEATDHVGGRTRNYDVGSREFDTNSDDVFEVGGTWLSPRHTAVLQLCRDLGIQVYNASFVDADPSASDGRGTRKPSEDYPWWYWGPAYPQDQMLEVNRTVFHSANGKFSFSGPVELNDNMDRTTSMQLSKAGNTIEQGSAAISAQCWGAETCGPLWQAVDVQSTGSALGKELTTPDAKQVLRNTIHTHNAQEPEEVGFLYNLFSFKGCNSGGPDNQYRVRGGTQAIPMASSARLGRNVTLNAVVQVVNTSSQGVQTHTSNGLHFASSAVVVTGPPAAVLGIQFLPPLPGVQAQLLQRMPMGTSLKFAAVYKEGPWWRLHGLQGDILATALPGNLTLPGTGIPLFVQCYDHSPFSRQLGIIACFVEGRQNLYFTTLPAERQEALMKSFLHLSFSHAVGSNVPEPAFFVSHNWADQPFARGAYTGYFPPGVLSVPEYWKAYGQMEKLPNVYLAGSDYHTGWGNGYIEGAVRSGQRAAGLVHMRLRGSVGAGERTGPVRGHDEVAFV